MADQPVKKKINRIKALVESAEGPARKDKSAVPIADAMSAYTASPRSTGS